MNFEIDIKLDELEINDSLYKRFFEEHMHLIKQKKHTSEKGFILFTAWSFCGKTTHIRLPEPPIRHASMYGIGYQEFRLMPGFTEREIHHTEVLGLVTCPSCSDDFVLNVLGDLP